jgi:hypothetical protein
MTKLEKVKGFLDWVSHGKLIFDLVVAIAFAKATKALLASFAKLSEIWRSPIEWFIGALILGILLYVGRNREGKSLASTPETPVIEPDIEQPWDGYGSAEAWGAAIEEQDTLANVPADPCVGLFSPLQLEAFQLAKDIRSFLKDFEPIPPADYGSTKSQRMRSSEERISWAKRLDSNYQLEFNDRIRKIELKLGAKDIHMDHSAIKDSARRGVEEYINRYADVLTAMAHRLDGVVLNVRTDVGA